MAIHYVFELGDTTPPVDQPGNSLVHTYGALGTFSVGVIKMDGDTEVASGTTTVTVSDAEEWLRARAKAQGSTFY